MAPNSTRWCSTNRAVVRDEATLSAATRLRLAEPNTGREWYDAGVRNAAQRFSRSTMLVRRPAVRLILATIRPGQVEIVRRALADVQVTRMTICDAQGHGSGPAPNGTREPAVTQEVVMEIACNDDFVERTVARLTAALGEGALGSGGDPRVVVLPIVEAVQIYREVRGPEAI